MSSDAGERGRDRGPVPSDGVERDVSAAPSPGVGPGDAEETDADDAAGFGRRGWVLVGVVLLSLVVIPGLIYAFPAAPADAGLPFLVAMLVLPMLPAVLLGAVAVWSMSAAHPGDE